MGLKKTEQKEFAKILFLDNSKKLTVKEIAVRVGVQEKTLAGWIKTEAWDRLRKSLLVTRKQMISDLYDQLEFLNNTIKNRENKVADSKEANTIAIITTSIKKLETEISIGEIYEVATQFLDYIKPVDFDMYQKLIPHFDVFIQLKLK